MRPVSLALLLASTACAPAASAWLSVDAHAGPKKKKAKKGKKGESPSSDKAGANPAQAGAMATTEGDAVRPKFGWTPGWSGAFEVTTTSTNVVNGVTVGMTAEMAGGIDVRAVGDDLGVRWETISVDMSPTFIDGVAQADEPHPVRAMVSEASKVPYEVRIGASDGTLKGLIAQGGTSYEDGVKAAFDAAIARLHDDQQLQVRAMADQLKAQFTSATILQESQDHWASLVGRWHGETFESGETYAQTWKQPDDYGTTLIYYGHISYAGDVPCQDGGDQTCAKLTASYDVDPLALSESLEAQTTATMAAAGMEEPFTISDASKRTEITLVADIATLRPWQMTVTETAAHTVTVGDQARTSSETTTDTWAFTW